MRHPEIETTSRIEYDLEPGEGTCLLIGPKGEKLTYSRNGKQLSERQFLAPKTFHRRIVITIIVPATRAEWNAQCRRERRQGLP